MTAQDARLSALIRTISSLSPRSMTKNEADELGIRDSVSFQKGNVLITNDGVNITLHYAEGDKGTAQRTGYRSAGGWFRRHDSDGRAHASSLGATRNDVIDLLVSYGAITAGMLTAAHLR